MKRKLILVAIILLAIMACDGGGNDSESSKTNPYRHLAYPVR